MPTLREHFERCALLALEKQDKLSRLIGDHVWELDLVAGSIRFDDRTFPFQVLGTESENTLTFLWAWANEQTEIPENLLASSLKLREWGRQEGVAEFTLPSVDVDRADGHMLAMISSVVVNVSCYYRAPYEGGAVYLLITAPEVDAQPPFGVAGFIAGFTSLAASYDLNHRSAFTSYLKAKNLPIVDKGPLVAAQLEAGEPITAEFDAAGRCASLNGNPVA
jgi:hypothetical protein